MFRTITQREVKIKTKEAKRIPLRLGVGDLGIQGRFASARVLRLGTALASGRVAGPRNCPPDRRLQRGAKETKTVLGMERALDRRRERRGMEERRGLR